MTLSTINPNLAVLSPSGIREALLTAFAAEEPLYIEGSPGISKSSVVRQVSNELFATSYGYTVDRLGHAFDSSGAFVPVSKYPWFRDLRGPLLDPVDLRGLPAADMIRKVTEWLTPDFFPTCGEGIILLDELPNSPPMVQNALYSLCLDRRIGDYELPSGWHTVGAGNRVTDGVGTGRLSLALAKRFVRVTMEPTLADWLPWAEENGLHPVVIGFQKFRDACPGYKSADSNVSFPNAFFSPNPKDPASPDPRAWHKVSKLLYAHEARPVSDKTIFAMVAGLVGSPITIEFMAFLSRWSEMQRLGDVYANGGTTAPVPDDVSTRYAVACHVAQRATCENLSAAITYLERLPSEYLWFALTDATRRDPDLTETRAYTDAILRHKLDLS